MALTKRPLFSPSLRDQELYERAKHLAKTACAQTECFPQPHVRLAAFMELTYMVSKPWDASAAKTHITPLVAETARRLICDAHFSKFEHTQNLAPPALLFLITLGSPYSHFREMPEDIRGIFISKDLRVATARLAKSDRHAVETRELATALSSYLVKIGADPTASTTPPGYVPRRLLTRSLT